MRSNTTVQRAFLIALTTLVLLLLLSACARTQPVLNITDEPVVTGSGETPSASAVRDAIIEACRAKKWLVDPSQDGLVIATAKVRQHTAVVDIRYTPESYSISYRDSEVLLYDGNMIHRNYNKWVQLLSERVNLEINKL